MSEITALSQRIANLEKTDKEQTDKLDEAVNLLRRMNTALSGDPALGITGIVATAKSAHRRLDEFEKTADERMTAIEEAAKKERWMGRIGSGVVGATITGIVVWIKGKLGIGGD